MRRVLSIVLNLLVPGCGLILMQRETLGTALAFAFAALGVVGVSGSWITPMSIPVSLTVVSLSGAAGVWGLGQLLLVSRWRTMYGANRLDEKASLIQMATEALADGVYVNARLALESAMDLDDEDLMVNLLWARLMTRLGRIPEARSAWRRVGELDREKEFHHEVSMILKQLPSAS